MKILLLVLALIILTPTLALTQEARCTELGSACSCSEPLNDTGYNQSNTFWWQGTAANSKPCTIDGIRGIVNNFTPTASSDAAVLARLPSGHTISRFYRSDNDHVGQWMAGSSSGPSGGGVRMALRWYVYRSSGYSMKTDTDLGQNTAECNSKVAETSGEKVIIDYTGGHHMYDFGEWTPSSGCCGSGGPDSLSSSQMRNMWIRYELVVAPRSGAGTRLQLYAKNVTTNGPELLVADSTANGVPSNSSPPATLTGMWANLFRAENNGSVCLGFAGISHVLHASWATNAGQRIGPAVEVEGGGGPVQQIPAAPGTPTVGTN